MPQSCEVLLVPSLLRVQSTYVTIPTYVIVITKPFPGVEGSLTKSISVQGYEDRCRIIHLQLTSTLKSTSMPAVLLTEASTMDECSHLPTYGLIIIWWIILISKVLWIWFSICFRKSVCTSMYTLGKRKWSQNDYMNLLCLRKPCRRLDNFHWWCVLSCNQSTFSVYNWAWHKKIWM